MMNEELTARLAYLADRTEIFDLVTYERFVRDQCDWQALLDCFTPNATVRTTWFDGNIQDFVEGSRRKMTGPNRTVPKHWIFPSKLQINGDRALVESPAQIFDRMTFDDVEFDSFQFCRFVSRAQKHEGRWKLASFEAIYQRDQIQPVDLSKPQPVDWEELKTYRPSYRFFAYIQRRRGYKANPDLLGDDRPEELAAFYAREQQWLETGK